MNSIPLPSSPRNDATVNSAPFARLNIALAALYWIERQMLRVDYGRFRKAHSSDAWWTEFDEQAEGPMPFEQVLEKVLHGYSPLKVVHQSASEEDVIPWRAISYRAWWLHPQTALIWTIGFWMATSLAGWAAVFSIFPPSWRTAVQVVYWIVAASLIFSYTMPEKFSAVLAFLSRKGAANSAE